MNLPCIFCKDATNPKNKEHVVWRALGGNLTLTKEVCEVCNSVVFPDLDKSLIDFVQQLVCSNHPDIAKKKTILQNGHAVWFDEVTERYNSVRLTTDGKPVLLPQLSFKGESAAFVVDQSCGMGYQGMLNAFIEELSAPENVQLKTIIFSTSEGKPRMNLSLIRSKENRYAVRAETSEDAATLQRIVEQGELFASLDQNSEARQGTETPQIETDLSFQLGNIERALGKAALEFYCSHFGHEKAMDSCFDDLRSYCLGSVQERCFTTLIFGGGSQYIQPGLVSELTREGHHTCLLMQSNGIWFVVFLLYQEPIAIVHLNCEAIESCSEVVVGFFDYASKTHRILSSNNREEFEAEFPLLSTPEEQPI